MSKITGRPKKPIVQEKFLGFFVTKVQHFVIQQKAEQAGVNISDYMRQVAINGFVKTRWTAEERDIFKKMVGIANDLHDLRELGRKEGVLSAMLFFEKYRDMIDEMLKRISHSK